MSTRTDDAARRSLIRQSPTLAGADYLEVDTTPEALNQRRLRVHLLAPDPPDDPGALAKNTAMLALLAAPENASMSVITGGVRVTGIEITARGIEAGALVLDVSVPGDFSDYLLRLRAPGLDPYFSEIAFSFKAGCPRRFDCQPNPDPAPVPAPTPAFDYLAKDYDSFRQGMIDLLPALIPAWTERRIPDSGIALLELLAYVGDRLSYRQDAVANEAYLDTARQRVSVRRHTRLIDYTLHEGLSAMTLLQVRVNAVVDLAGHDTALQALCPGPAGPAPGSAIDPGAAGPALASAITVFEAPDPAAPPRILGTHGTPGRLYPAHNQIHLHSWANARYTLPAGTTEADLQGTLTTLHPGDLLLLTETLDPDTGLAADADPTHRQVIRLSSVDPPDTDPLTGTGYTRVRWDPADALRFNLAVCGYTADGTGFENGAVAHGNLVPGYAGRSITEEHQLPDNPTDPRHTTLALESGPLGFLPGGIQGTLPAAALTAPDPAGGLPAITRVTATAPGTPDTRWVAVTGDLLDSDPFDRVFVVETGNDGTARLRFGDGQHGAIPDPGSTLHISYRVGNGNTGNIGAGTLDSFIREPWLTGIDSVHQFLPATGGTDPQSTASAQALAPAAFHATTYCAVTAEDYAAAAATHPQVLAATARFRYTGSWYTVNLYILPAHGRTLTDAATAELSAHMQAVALAGYDLQLRSPRYVPLTLSLHLCPAPGFLGPDVEQAVRHRLVSGPGAYFAPGAFGFGAPLYLSSLLAAVQAVPGVGSFTVTGFARRYDPAPDATATNLDRGHIPAAGLEVLRLDADPDFPENGVLDLSSGG